MFVYNTQSKKTSPSAYGECADVKIQEERNLPRADRHLSHLQHPIPDPGCESSTGLTVADQFSLQQDPSKALQKDSVM